MARMSGAGGGGVTAWPPDAFALCAVGLAGLLEWLAPLPLLPAAHLASPVGWCGAVLALAGLGLEVAAARALGRAGTTTRPGEAPTALVTTGVFARSRNPFYCGWLMVLAGLFVAFSLDWGLVALPALWIVLDRVIIPREEAILSQRFAHDFAAYRRRVRRWL